MSNKNKSNAIGRRTQDTLTAFIVAEPLGIKNYFRPSGIPIALAPVANRPVIDYTIENLIQNGVRKIIVLAAHSECEVIRNHISLSWSHVGVGGVANSAGSSSENNNKNVNKNSDAKMNGAMKTSNDMDHIEVRACQLFNGFFDVITHLKNYNLVRDGSYFLIVPLDSISNISNIQQLVTKAIDRHVNHKLILTAVVRQDDQSLRSVYNAVMMRELSRMDGADVDGAPDSSFLLATPAVSSQFARYSLAAVDVQEDDEEQMTIEKAFTPRCTIVFDPSTGMIHAFREWKELDDDALESIREERGVAPGDGVEAPFAPIASLPMKKNSSARVCVRTDLMVTGILICSSDVINCSFDSFQVSITDVLNEFIARQIEWNIDIAIDTADSNAVVLPISSLPSFLAANQRVCNRYLHPMTRESNFGDVVGIKYSVSRRAPLVCVPQEGCPALRGIIEGGGVFGQSAAVHESSFVSNSSMGDFSSVGKNTHIVNSVISKNVVIGNNAVVINSFILSGAVVPDGCEVRDSIFGMNAAAHVSYSSARNGNTLKRHNNRISDANGKEMDFSPNNIITTYEMLTSDNVTGANNDDDDKDEDWKEVLWGSYLNNKDVETSLEIGLKDLRTSFHKTNNELVRAMFERLVVYLGQIIAEETERLEEEENDDDDDEDEVDIAAQAWSAARAKLFEKLLLWESSALWHFITLGDDDGAMEILRGISIGIAKTVPMQPFGGKLLAVLYCLLDAKLFDKREFCIVTSSAIISFLKEMDDQSSGDDEDSEEESDDSDEEDEEDEDELIKIGWRYFSNYAGKVRESCEDDDDDDDEDDDSDDDEEEEED